MTEGEVTSVDLNRAAPKPSSLQRRGAVYRLAAVGAAVAAALALVASVLAAPADEAADLCAAGAGSLLGSAVTLSTDARLFQTTYNKSAWTGNVLALALDSSGAAQTTPLWQATAQIPVAASRAIFTASAAPTGVDFRWSAMPVAMQEKFGDATTGPTTVDYLRGDPSLERANGGTLRDRAARLGAIVNSEITLAGVENFDYGTLPDPAGSAYPAFVQTKGSRPHLVIVGANDGMLHGFDAATGIERFAYVPRALVREPIDQVDTRSTLVRQASPSFAPRYYVDGSSWVGDAYWGTSWKTVVVGTAGAGARGVFAIDITDPGSVSAGSLLFDLSDVGGDEDPNLGYSFGQPVIGRLSDGNFYAIFGNGRASERQCPVLYVMRLSDGVVRRIPTGGRSLASSCADVPNGLGRPSLYDVRVSGETGYRVTDFVYAGDLQGNVWRFDLRSIAPSSDPPSGVGVQLLFQARNDSNQPQPITGTIEVGTGPLGGTGSLRPAMLWFGTGRYLAETDAADATVQSMYGIVDRFTGGGDANTAKVLRGNLQAQTANISGDTAGTITGPGVNYAGGEDGWYIALPHGGERMTGLPLIQTGRLFFSTLVPKTGVAACYASGQAWIYAVDPYNGRALAQRVFVNSPALDFIASSVGVLRGLAAVDAGDRAFLYGGGTSAGGRTIQAEEIRTAARGGLRGRVSWREIVR